MIESKSREKAVIRGAFSLFLSTVLVKAVGLLYKIPLSYILGDEGSGAVLGRLLVNALYKGMLPASMIAEFENEYQTDMMGVIERVYRKPAANRWLASLSPFVCKHIDCPEVEGLVISNFDTFVERNILPYNRPDLPVSFVGSIAHYYGRQLRQSVESHGLVMGRVLRSPLDAMI